MQRLHELRALVQLSRGFGQEPTDAVLRELAQLERIEAGVRERSRQAMAQILEGVDAEPEVEAQPLTEEVLVAPEPETQPLPEPAQSHVQRAMDILAHSVREATVVGPEPALVSRPTDALVKKIENLERWISRIAATGPGGGAGEVYNLTIPARSVTSDYTIGRKDYYVGVSSSVKTYITLPVTGGNVKEGRVLVIKDESGHAQLTPIGIVGTIDGDPNGAEIRINNGAVQLLYHNGGWRII